MLSAMPSRGLLVLVLVLVSACFGCARDHWGRDHLALRDGQDSGSPHTGTDPDAGSSDANTPPLPDGGALACSNASCEVCIDPQRCGTSNVQTLGDTNDESARALVLDGKGSVYVTGTVTAKRSADADNDAGAGAADAITFPFLWRYDANIGSRWEHEFSINDDADAAAIAIDASGENVYVVGTTRGPRQNAQGETIESNELFVSKWSALGAELWRKQWGTDYEDIASAVAVNREGRVVVSGVTAGKLGTQLQTAQYDAFLVTLDPADGTLLETRQWGIETRQSVASLYIDADDNVFVSGTHIFPSPKRSPTDQDVMTTRWNSNETLGWTSSCGTPEADETLGRIAVDAMGGVFVSGSTGGTFDRNHSVGGDDAFVTRWRPDGTRNWTTQWGSRGAEVVRDVALADNGLLYVVGMTDGDFADTHTPASTGKSDMFISLLSTSGKLLMSQKVQPGARTLSASAMAIEHASAAQPGVVYIVGDTQAAAGGPFLRTDRDAFLYALYTP